MSHINIPNVKFYKSGVQVKGSLNVKITKIQNGQDKIKADIEVICKDRDVSVDEVLGARTEEAVTAYSTKMSAGLGHMGNARGNAALMALQEDLNKLRSLANTHQDNEDFIKGLTRIYDNVGDGAKFIISYEELVLLGF